MYCSMSCLVGLFFTNTLAMKQAVLNWVHSADCRPRNTNVTVFRLTLHAVDSYFVWCPAFLVTVWWTCFVAAVAYVVVRGVFISTITYDVTSLLSNKTKLWPNVRKHYIMPNLSFLGQIILLVHNDHSTNITLTLSKQQYIIPIVKPTIWN